MRQVLARVTVVVALGALGLAGGGPALAAPEDPVPPAPPAAQHVAARSGAKAVAPTAVSPGCSRTVLRYGSRGYCVTELQFNLNILYGFGLALDGSYGPATTSAVYRVQARYGLTYDGICGPQTWRTIAWALDRARAGLPY